MTKCTERGISSTKKCEYDRFVNRLCSCKRVKLLKTIKTMWSLGERLNMWADMHIPTVKETCFKIDDGNTIVTWDNYTLPMSSCTDEQLELVVKHLGRVFAEYNISRTCPSGCDKPCVK